YPTAIERIQRAIKLKSTEPNFYSDLGKAYLEQGQFKLASECYQQALHLSPDDADTYRKLGIVYKKQENLSEALQCYQKAIQLRPDYAEAYISLGNIFKLQGKPTEAIQSYQQALQFNPNLFETYNNLGNVLRDEYQLEEAIAAYRKALQLNPDYANTYFNLGNVLQAQGKVAQAIQCFQQAIQKQPNYSDAYSSLGYAYTAQGNLEEAIASYHRALQLKPDDADTYNNLGTALQTQGKVEEAIESYHRVLQLKPDHGGAKINICMSQLLILYSTSEEIKLNRHNYQQYLQSLASYYTMASQGERANAADAVGSKRPFYLAYQGLNDRDLQNTYGRLICQLMSSRYPQWSRERELPQLANGEKIRIGFVSHFFNSHSNWDIPIKGWIENLDNYQFELFGYYTGSTQDLVTARAQKSFAKFIQGPLPLEKWCKAIAQDKLHVLIFPEFGMDSMTVQLGCLRLAPIQMTSWGHPDTSGMPTMDYYLSSDLMEPENAQDHYTEKLVRLPNLSIYYTPLEVQPKVISKAQIGIEDNEIMFWCCQNISKYLPAHDDVFPRIAKKTNRCKFVFIQYMNEGKFNEIFRQRLNQAFQNFGINYEDYCIFLPRLSLSTFAGTAAIADIFLDSIAWSGCNSTLEAIQYDIPIVTWPGDLMRGRHSLAILKMMGVEETIASSKDDYVKIASHLGQDYQYRQYISQRMGENKHKLYGDLKPIRALEVFLTKLVKSKNK
ncbi:MAG TPA: glycosyl transferase family 2, partial [Cyanobacteria bacterium UBA8803]|nr:glycosyl transferase family 2 [Cyanobacteria bacterium UBA9273]HBL62781.1 glycosyl transferase family 2 [Cyanobacteria bacterium UBA8803]